MMIGDDELYVSVKEVDGGCPTCQRNLIFHLAGGTYYNNADKDKLKNLLDLFIKKNDSELCGMVKDELTGKS